MTKVVVNKCFGGFSLSAAGIRRYAELAGFNVYPFRSDYSTGFANTVLIPLDPDNADGFLVDWYKDPAGSEYFNDRDLPRDDPLLVQVVEELGDASSGSCAELRVVDIPEMVDWIVEEYDGNEWVAERHRTW
jgi:hypothetical protein